MKKQHAGAVFSRVCAELEMVKKFGKLLQEVVEIFHEKNIIQPELNM